MKNEILKFINKNVKKVFIINLCSIIALILISEILYYYIIYLNENHINLYNFINLLYKIIFYLNITLLISTWLIILIRKILYK